MGRDTARFCKICGGPFYGWDMCKVHYMQEYRRKKREASPHTLPGGAAELTLWEFVVKELGIVGKNGRRFKDIRPKEGNRASGV
jgi:hypothetical protein